MANGTLLNSVPAGVITWTVPLEAPTGTVVKIWEREATVNAADTPLKVTLVAPLRLFPRIRTDWPTGREVGTVSTNGPRPVCRTNTVPHPPGQAVLVPPEYVVP